MEFRSHVCFSAVSDTTKGGLLVPKKSRKYIICCVKLESRIYCQGLKRAFGKTGSHLRVIVMG
jgi:hypothetical protein